MITFLMSVYCGESCDSLYESLNSLCMQTDPDFCVVLVIDGPLESSHYEIIQNFVVRLNVKLVPLEKNVGLAAALNVGLEHVDTDWVARFDTDDICDPERVKVTKRIISACSCDVFGSYIYEFKTNPLSVFSIRPVPVNVDKIKKYILNRNPFNHMTVCYKRSLIDRVGGYPNIKYAEDYGLWINVIASGAKPFNLPYPLVWARVNESFFSRRGGVVHLISNIKIESMLVRKMNKKIIHAIISYFARALLVLMPGDRKSVV